MDKQLTSYNWPDKRGHFSRYGGKYVPEALIPALEELETCYREVQKDPLFQKELASLLKHYSGRPTPLYHADNLSAQLGFQVWLKREDLNHTGAHKINNALGQILLARRMGENAHYCRNGSGPAWCSHGDGRGPLWPEMYGVYGSR